MELSKFKIDSKSQTPKDLNSSCTRKRLLEQAFVKDNILHRDSQSCDTEKSFSASSKSSTLKGLQQKQVSSKKPEKTEHEKKQQSRSKSPTCTRRNRSFDATKLNPVRMSHGKSSEKITAEAPSSLKKPQEKPTDPILKITSQFSIKKVTV